jgi:DNA invertase Pin-like site-specific DNA recombinase
MDTEQGPRFVELVRVSSEGQANRDTPEDQRRALDQLRETRPGIFVERIDSTVSGTRDADDRKDIQRLTQLAGARAFDEVRVRHTDRLTRHPDPRERFLVFGLIADAKAKIVDSTGREIDPQSDMGEMMWYFDTLMSSREAVRITVRTQDGKRRVARQGRLAQGQPPYGRTFDTGTGTWGLAPKRAETYRRMFSLCLDGLSLNEIAERLNRDGFAPPTRVPEWTGSNVAKLLRDPAAKGVYTTHAVSFEIPKIVDEETFEAVRAKLRANNSTSAKSGPRPRVFALLRGRAACGICGARIYTQRGGGTPARYVYYRCSASGETGTHRTYYLRVDHVDAVVVAELAKFFDHKTPDMVRTVKTHDEGTSPEARRAALKEEIAAAKKELRSLDVREKNTARLVTTGAVQQKTGRELLDEVKRLRVDATERIVGAESQLGAVVEQADLEAAIAAEIERFRGVVAKTPAERWRWLVERMLRPGDVLLFPSGEVKFFGSLPLDAVQNPSGPSETMSARRGRPGRARARRAGR